MAQTTIAAIVAVIAMPRMTRLTQAGIPRRMPVTTARTQRVVQPTVTAVVVQKWCALTSAPLMLVFRACSA
jgi:hypothetical protein